MSAGQLHLTIEQGTDFDRTITWKDASGAIVDISGYTAQMQARTRIDSSETFLDLNSAEGALAIDGSNGQIHIHIPASDTASITAQQGIYDLKLTSASGQIIRLLEGHITLSPEVTR